MNAQVLNHKYIADECQYEFFLTTSKGEKIPVIHNVHIEKDEAGNTKGGYGTVTDIREQKKIQQELESTNQTLESTKDLVLNSLETLEKEKNP